MLEILFLVLFSDLGKETLELTPIALVAKIA
jgi:hypothetical protein